MATAGLDIVAKAALATDPDLAARVAEENQKRRQEYKDGQKRVPMWDKKNKRKISGFVSPMQKNLAQYLETHPNHEIYDSKRARKKAKVTEPVAVTTTITITPPPLPPPPTPLPNDLIQRQQFEQQQLNQLQWMQYQQAVQAVAEQQQQQQQQKTFDALMQFCSWYQHWIQQSSTSPNTTLFPSQPQPPPSSL